ncbi:hypothetical protein BSK54_10360 [Paenibacillus odorifer]|uniref:hypothetical protein n=1 Tax=Paenibacillus odorifer TaxID=189426 RepID=UPI00096C8123|nr:hypothetical protein [Paenibacillus odorifer]OME02652.1 hypothetical protein BSK54_10360 [Paenibacillus odorifer]
MAKSTVQQLASELTNNVDTFEDYLISLTNSGEIYERQYGDILSAALHESPNWDDIFKIISPITREIIIFTAENHQDIFQELLMDIKKAHDKLVGMREEMRGDSLDA